MKKLDNNGIKKILSVARGWISDTARELEARVPSGGKDGQILMATADGAGKWIDIDLINSLSYGVEWDASGLSATITRVGNPELHRSLPIQSAMKGCIFNPIQKKVVYWLDDDNWYYKEGGNPEKGQPEQRARLDGYDGEIYVYVPEFWIKSFIIGVKRQVRICPVKIDDSWEHQEGLFMAAWKITVLRSVPENMGYLSTLSVNAPVCVINFNEYCRGGRFETPDDSFDEDSCFGGSDSLFTSTLGKCIVTADADAIRSLARQNNKEIISYRQYKNILYWLYVIEYANFDCQADMEDELTPEGFRKGGLGKGIVAAASWMWEFFNGRNPITPAGYLWPMSMEPTCDSVDLSGNDQDEGFFYNADTDGLRWRGIENPFGDTYTYVEGLYAEYPKSSSTAWEIFEIPDNAKWGLSKILGAKDSKLLGTVNPNDRYTEIRDWNTQSTSELIPEGQAAWEYCYTHDGISAIKTDSENGDTVTYGKRYPVLFGGDCCSGPEYNWDAIGLGSIMIPTVGLNSSPIIGYRLVCDAKGVDLNR